MRVSTQLLAWSLTLPVICSVSAQQAVSFHGSVVDSTDAVIPGATIQILDASDKIVAETHSDSAGHFVFRSLPSGRYDLSVPAYNTFAALRTHLRLDATVDAFKITLAAESITQDVQVVAEEPLSVDPAANTDTVKVTGEQLRKAPIFDQDPIATMSAFLDDASGSSGGVTIIVDGVQVKNLNVSASAIQEIHINNDPYSLEYQRPGRGRIEVLTKPGSAQFHGELNFTFRDAVFNAKNHFAVVKPPESRRIYEGHLSGPVGHGRKTNFILSMSRQEQDTAAIVNAIGPHGVINENVSTPNRRLTASGGITHDFSENSRLNIRYATRLNTNQNFGVGGLVLPEAGYNRANREDDLYLTHRWIVTPNLVNQFQMMIEKDEDNNVSTTMAPSVVVSGAFTGGGAQSDQHLTENTFHLNDVVAWSHGRHYITGAIQLPQVSRRAVDDHTNRLGTLQYASLSTLASNKPYVYTVQRGLGRTVYWMNEFGAYIQDQVRLTPKLQLTAGLRYDRQSFLGDNNNFAPRFSVAYAPGNGRTILRTGSGVFYDFTGGDFPATVRLHDGVNLRQVQVQNPNFPLPSGPVLDALPTNIAQFAPHVRSPYSFQYSAGVERRVGKKGRFSAEYRGLTQIKSFRSVDINAPVLPPNAQIGMDFPRPDSSYGRIQSVESSGRAMLNSLDLGFRGEIGQYFSGQAQYVFARLMNNSGGISMYPQDQYHPNLEWGRGDMDRRHKFDMIGRLLPDRWYSLGVAATLYSGLPYTEITGNDDFHTGLGNARPSGVARNTLQAAATISFDVLYSHDFRIGRHSKDNEKFLSAGLSAFNVFNYSNYQKYVGTLTSSAFGQPTSALPGRQLQLSLGYRF
ncbi:TonB-dependent receptor [Terriglobus roseus]|uniref:Outer membrane receptor proteins, mostly Fe transport n=1 Tax=Terriglobus roseus TaxID=392734 RepID=A0A1G7KQ20_9BACT|nr:TonB-dependent receptor [Terriglobus roseus]SDF39333.1 Outer membrane receptor proteins, mostly Fe transport [Terriglobus roseus]